MKIENIKINSYGILKEKEINLKDNLNIIYGKNESGKSTLLNYMKNIFYGISKNKRGKEFSDYDRYKPWKTEEFSGKLTYTLDNGKKYEVFRDFNKKNPKIYDEELNDISKEFTIDKNNGNQFFTEQTKIDEATFISTLVSMQQEVRLGKQEQNTLLQKLANLAGTGEDNVSYKKAIEKINKRQVEEIGTIRSQGRPINIIKQEQFKLQDEIGELEEYKEKQYEIEEIKQQLEEKIKQDEEKLKLVKELKTIEETEKIEKQKIVLNENILNENNEKIEKLKLNRKQLENEINKIKVPNRENKKTNKSQNIIYIAIMIITVILAIILKNNTIALIAMITIFIIGALVLIISNIINIKKIAKQNKNIEKQISKANNEKQEIQINIDKINTQIDLLIKNSDEQAKAIKNAEDVLKKQIENERNQIKNKYKLEEINVNNISFELENIQNSINKNKLEIHSLEIDKISILPKLEKLAQMEEELQELNEKEQNLLKLNSSMELAKQILEIAYTKMKENVTPKFTKNLSKNIEEISDGKYKNVRINDEEGIIVEKENGEYISSEKLSIRNNRPAIHIIKARSNKRTIRRKNANNTR